jgi:hypothetical protein
MLLTIVNLTTHETEFADPSGNSTFKVKVAGSATKTDVEITDEEFTALEPLLNTEKTAGHITWTVKRSAATLADDVPYAIKTQLTTPYNAVADEDLVFVNLSIAGASSVVLPVAAQIGHEVTVLDGKGDSASNNITVTVASAGTINGASSFVISTNKGGAKFIKVSATEWRGLFLVGATGAPTGTAGGDLAGSFPNPTLAAASVEPFMVDASSFFVKEEDFPLSAGGTLPAPLAKDLNNTASGDYLANVVNGVYSLATAAVSEAQDAQLTYGNQLVLDPTLNLIFEARVRINIPGATISADERWVVGLCSAHTNSEDALDAVVSNVWFRGEGANLNIFIEGDDGTHDTDDTDSTVDYVDNVYLLFKIDMTDLATVKFYINGTLVGTTLNLSSLTNANLLQPIFCYQRDAGTEINLLQVDWFRVSQDRV